MDHKLHYLFDLSIHSNRITFCRRQGSGEHASINRWTSINWRRIPGTKTFLSIFCNKNFKRSMPWTKTKGRLCSSDMKQNVSILLLYRGNRFLGTVSLYFGVDNTFKFNGLGACQEEEFVWSLAWTMILKNKNWNISSSSTSDRHWEDYLDPKLMINMGILSLIQNFNDYLVVIRPGNLPHQPWACWWIVNCDDGIRQFVGNLQSTTTR